MNTKYRPLYLIITEKVINLKFLRSTIKYVCWISIKWEIHTKSKLISQCHRYQEWGHANHTRIALLRQNVPTVRMNTGYINVQTRRRKDMQTAAVKIIKHILQNALNINEDYPKSKNRNNRCSVQIGSNPHNKSLEYTRKSITYQQWIRKQ